jgi:KEOPS complex subunit Cgi121
MVKIVGTKGNIQNIDRFVQNILELAEKYNITIQALDANVVYGKDHLVSAVQHAKRAFEQGRNATNSLAMEILLYASGERQIQKSIQKVGVKAGRGNIAFVFDGNISNDIIETIFKTLDISRDDKVLEGNIYTLRKFGLTQREIETVPESHYGHLILERIALVDVIK